MKQSHAMLLLVLAIIYWLSPLDLIPLFPIDDMLFMFGAVANVIGANKKMDTQYNKD